MLTEQTELSVSLTSLSGMHIGTAVKEPLAQDQTVPVHLAQSGDRSQ
jgi:hypothetical protein